MAHQKRTVAGDGNVADNANTYSYSGSFDVFKGTEVVALLDGVALTYTATTINDSASPRQYSVDTVAKTIHIGGADLTSGNSVVIRPETDMGDPTPRAEYTPGSSITSDDLNNNQLQLMRKALEYDDQKLSSVGGTMTGNLTMGEDTTIIFEGATDDAHETTLTVVDPTADRTITLPNVTGTVVTTGDTATVTATMMAPNSVDSSELVDGSVDNSHLADDAVNSDELASGAVDLDHMSPNSVDSDQYVDGSIDTDHIADANVTLAKLEDVSSAQIIVGNGSNRPTAVAVSGDLTLANTGAFTIGSGAVTGGKLGYDAVSGDKIGDNAVNSEHIMAGAVDLAHMSAESVDSDQYVDGSIDTAHIGAAQVTLAKVEALTSGEVIVGNGSNRPTAVAMSGDVAIAAGGATTIQANAVEIGMIGCEQTTISDSDSHIPTSGAVVDYVTDALTSAGSFEVVATEDDFPDTHPDPKASASVAGIAGMVVSIQNAGGLSINSSGVATNARKASSGSDDITINGFPSSMRGGVGGNADPYVLSDETGLLVTTTAQTDTAYASGAVYDFHRVAIKPADYVQLSDDINDFKSRYRVTDDASGVRTGLCGTDGTGSGSFPCDGDMAWFKGVAKMYVFDPIADFNAASNSAKDACWTEVSSVGDYKLLGIKDDGQAHNGTGPTFNGSNDQYDLFDGTSDANVTNAGQLLVILNGVLQKPNPSYDASGEGFALDGNDGIRFCDPPPSGSTLFVTQIGSATTINVPADGSVTSAKLAAGAVNLAAMASEAVDEDNLYISNAGSNGQFLQKQSGNNGGLTWATASDTNVLSGGTITGDVIFDNATNAGIDMTWDMSDNAFEFTDGAKAVFGTGDDYSISYHGGDDQLNITTTNTDANIYFSGGKIESFGAELAMTGGADIVFGQTATSDELMIGYQHGGNGSRLSNTHSAGLKIWSDHGKITKESNTGFEYLVWNDGAGVDLYHADTKEFGTKTGGVQLFGHSECAVNALGNVSTNPTFDFTVANYITLTITGDITVQNPTTESVGQSGSIIITQPADGPHTCAWSSNFKWTGGTAPVLTAENNAVDRIDYLVVAADQIHCVASLDVK